MGSRSAGRSLAPTATTACCWSPRWTPSRNKGLIGEIGTFHLDHGYDNGVVRQLCAEIGLGDVIVAKRRRHGTGRVRLDVPLGMRWPVERTNSWLSNFGQLRRNTDRFIHQRLAQFALAIALIITIKLIKWATHYGNTVGP